MTSGAKVVEEEAEDPVPGVLLTECDPPGDEEGVRPDLAPGAVPGPLQGCVGDGDGGDDGQVWRVGGAGVVYNAVCCCMMMVVILD